MHCLEEWRVFRSGYRRLTGPLRRRVLGGAGLLGLSASFPVGESCAWMNELGEGRPRVRVGVGLGRENLTLRVVPIETEEQRWVLLISALRGLRASWRGAAWAVAASRAVRRRRSMGKRGRR
mgnify:CR=1 FL=1